LILFQSWPTDGSPIVLVAYGVAGIAALFFTARLVPAFPSIRGLFIVFTVTLIGIPVLTGVDVGWRALQTTELYRAPARPTNMTGPGAPDVLIVVLDGYAGGDALRSYFAHDNSAYEDRLASMGVQVVSGAVSNYAKTQMSVAVLLEGRYPAIGAPGDLSFNELASVHAGNNILFASLDGAGYETHLFDNAWTYTRCGSNVDVCHGSGFNELDHLVYSRTPLGEAPPLQVHPWISSSIDQFTEATALVRERSPAPRLIYLHALLPHPPLHLAPDCTIRPDALGTSKGVVDTRHSRAAYGDQVDCVNAMIMTLVEATAEDAVVFITGDHGVRWTTGGVVRNSDAPWRSPFPVAGSVFTAYRYPRACDGPPSHSTLMGATATLFACLGIDYTGPPERGPTQPNRFFDQEDPQDGYYMIEEVTDVFVGAPSVTGP
jgi:hypothetical protein